MKTRILNSQGQPIVLDMRESKVVKYLEKVANNLGYKIDITSLTAIVKDITEQKFYDVAPADYIPVVVGQGAFSDTLTTYRSFNLGDDFATGLVNTGANTTSLASADAAVDSVTVKVFDWAKQCNWSLVDIQKASRSGNWDIVTQKEMARKKNWDLGIQGVFALGLVNNPGALGFLNQSGITPNTTLITKTLTAMTAAELSTFISGSISAYRLRTNSTAMPSALTIPESDFLGLTVPFSSTYPIKSKLEQMLESYKIVTNNPNFKILPLAFAEAAKSSGKLSVDRYVMHKYDPQSIRMDIPVDYTSTVAQSINGYQLNNVAYGEFTGVLAYRPLELFYMDLTV